jgi:hypothetical protein
MALSISRLTVSNSTSAVSGGNSALPGLRDRTFITFLLLQKFAVEISTDGRAIEGPLKVFCDEATLLCDEATVYCVRANRHSSEANSCTSNI